MPSQERESNISRGKEIIKKESTKLGIEINAKEIALLPGYENISDLAEQLGAGETTISQLARYLEKEFLKTKLLTLHIQALPILESIIVNKDKYSEKEPA